MNSYSIEIAHIRKTAKFSTLPILAADPTKRCLVRPSPPFSFGEKGSVMCDPERPGEGWNPGDTCEYRCPEG